MMTENPNPFSFGEQEPVSPPSRLGPKGISDSVYRRVVAAAELAYTNQRTVVGIGRVLPTPEQIGEICNVQNRLIVKITTSREFKNELARRGIRWTENPKVNSGLTPEQILVLGIVTDPTNRKPFAEKLKSAGISYATYRNWLKNPAFSERVRALGEQMLDENISVVHQRLTNKAAGGDMQAIKLFYEVSGRHDPAKQQTLDIARIIGLVLESLTRRVRDPEILMGVSSDLDVILSGGTPKEITELPNNYVASDAVLSGKVVANHDYGSVGDAVDDTSSGLPEGVRDNLTKLFGDNFFDFEKED